MTPGRISIQPQVATYFALVRWSLWFIVIFTFVVVLVGNVASRHFVPVIFAMLAIGVVWGIWARLRESELGEGLRAVFAGERSTEMWDQASAGRLGLGVVILAAAGLFLELGLIRWHSSIIPMFAFYKNFSLLACFAGLGLGYALSNLRGNFLALTLTLVPVQVACLLMLRYAGGDSLSYLMASPVGEQTDMGLGSLSAVAVPAVYGLLVSVFATTVVAFIPLGHLTGRFMDRLPRLEAYGYNLLGSIAGVAAFTGVSFLWAPPVVWFVAVAAVAIAFIGEGRLERNVGLGALFGIVVLLSWPVDPTSHRIYSPYQLIERTADPESGLMRIQAAGTYLQRVYDFSPGNRNRDSEHWGPILRYYDLPYLIAKHVDRVAIVGAGSGNDAAAALRAGAKEVVAVEIDPAVVALGRAYHPEGPYNNPRVKVVVNDARTFFRTTDETFDAVIYGVLDSHGQLSHASSVRIDSFVYTLEGFRESWSRLVDGGIMYVSYTLLTDSQGARIFKMMQLLSGQNPKVAYVADAPHVIAFVLRKGGEIDGWDDFIRGMGFRDIAEKYATLTTDVDIPTDDWPFFYMVKRTYPVSYLPALSLMLLVTTGFGRRLLLGTSFRRSSSSFFFLGAAFMLLETKAITVLGLQFGNTWLVIPIVIVAILTMAFLANLVVERTRKRSLAMLYPVLIATTALAYFTYGVSLGGAYVLDQLLSIVILTVPLFFSGIVFSSELARAEVDVSQAIGVNILGALFGGLLEYNSMYFGFAFLCLMAAALYLAAMLASLATQRDAKGDVWAT